MSKKSLPAINEAKIGLKQMKLKLMKPASKRSSRKMDVHGLMAISVSVTTSF